jgi:ligand-binding SRPBCC domain-containing protein
MAIIELQSFVRAPVERCFDLSRSVDLHLHTSASTGEQVVGPITSGLLGLDEEVTWRARHFGVRQHLTSRITAYDRPAHFRDSMVRGAFARFDHDHWFDAQGGGTLMRERFDFHAPLGILGRIAERAFLTAYMRRFLEGRMETIRRVAEGDDWQRFVPADRDAER